MKISKYNQRIRSTFSVLMSVYDKERASNLSESIESIKEQSRADFELVLVKDGPLTPELDRTIEEATNSLKSTIVYLEKNVGLASALDEGLRNCEHDIVVRCDSDDINFIDRFALLVGKMEDSPSLSFLGSQIIEFYEEREKYILTYSRIVPLCHEEIANRAASKSPMNHASVCFRKPDVFRLGGYSSSNIKSMEDYALWLKAISNGMVFQNLAVPLVFCRADNSMYNRRRGFKYAIDEFRLFSLARKIRKLSIGNIAVLCGRVLCRFLHPRALKMVYVKCTSRIIPLDVYSVDIFAGIPNDTRIKFCNLVNLDV